MEIPESQSVFARTLPTSATTNIIHTTFDECGWKQRLAELRTKYSNPIDPEDKLSITAYSVECSETQTRVVLAISKERDYSVIRAEAIFKSALQPYNSDNLHYPLRNDAFLYDYEEDETLEVVNICN